MLTPIEIKQKLDEVVIGQEHAKKALAIEIFKHYLKIDREYDLDISKKKISKSNILMTGLTGTGKTFLAQTLANILEVPFAIADATCITSAGYVGEDVESILLKLIQNADYDIERAEHGIIYIDEIDKLSRKSENPSITRDVSGEAVQQGLLKILEGTIARVPPQGGRKHPSQECININTSNILFIGGGSFEGIENIVKERLQTKCGKNIIGFNAKSKSIDINELTDKEIRSNITIADLKRYGMLPELLGRFTILTNLQPLELNDLVDILKLKKGIIQEYQTIFELQGKKLKITDDALTEIAKISLDEKTGARGLRYIIEKVMFDVMFNAPSEMIKKKYTITDNEVKYIYNENNKIELKSISA